MTEGSSSQRNAEAWGLPNVLDYFQNHRTTSEHVYPSEWIFLRDRLKEGMSILDIGCAQGGFAGIAGEHLKEFFYTGVDINEDMVGIARDRFPRHEFLCIEEGNLSALGDVKFDLVLILGILHLHEAWRDTLEAGWRVCSGSLIFDLREYYGATIEDKSRSSFEMNFGAGGDDASVSLPYNLINAAEAEETISDICDNVSRIEHYGYRHAVSESARTPEKDVITRTWCVAR